MTERTSNTNAFAPRAQDGEAGGAEELNRRWEGLDPQLMADRMVEALPGALFVTGSMGFAALAVTGMRYLLG